MLNPDEKYGLKIGMNNHGALRTVKFLP